MRRSEITDELIRLSKLAKELGFPQDMDKGDWYLGGDKKTLELIETTGYFLIGSTLILSFSRCLEWLNKAKYGVTLGFNTFIWDQYIFFVGTQSSRAKTHHEAIAKAVCKVLEGEG